MGVEQPHRRASGFTVCVQLKKLLLLSWTPPLVLWSRVGAGFCSWKPQRPFLKSRTNQLNYLTLTVSLLQTYFPRLLSSTKHFMPSSIQLEHVTSPSAAIWYFNTTSQRTFRTLHAALALPALFLLRLLLNLLKTPVGLSCLSVVDWATTGNSSVDAHADDAEIVLVVLIMIAAFPRDSRISDQVMWVNNTLRV
jgi:hypothetical protein